MILTGASRTSKTPTCVYLAIRGVRAANIPLVPGMAPPPALLAANRPLIVGLWVSPDRLVQVRRNRLTSMGEGRDTDYIDLDIVRDEITATRQLFEQHDWPLDRRLAPLDRGNRRRGDESSDRAAERSAS